MESLYDPLAEEYEKQRGKKQSRCKGDRPIDLARYVLDNVAHRRFSSANNRPQEQALEPFPPTVLMKLDIDGSEHQYCLI